MARRLDIMLPSNPTKNVESGQTDSLGNRQPGLYLTVTVRLH